MEDSERSGMHSLRNKLNHIIGELPEESWEKFFMGGRQIFVASQAYSGSRQRWSQSLHRFFSVGRSKGWNTR
jgi:hypothetical protein